MHYLESLVNAISISFCVFEVITYWMFLQQFEKRHLLCQYYIFLSLLLLSISISFGQPPDYSVQCWIQGFLGRLCGMSATIWGFIVCYMLYDLAVTKTCFNIDRKHMMLGWFAPFVFTLLPMTTDRYGKLHDGFCSLVTRADSPAWSLPLWRWTSSFIIFSSIFLSMAVVVRVAIIWYFTPHGPVRSCYAVLLRIFSYGILLCVTIPLCWVIFGDWGLYLTGTVSGCFFFAINDDARGLWYEYFKMLILKLLDSMSSDPLNHTITSRVHPISPNSNSVIGQPSYRETPPIRAHFPSLFDSRDPPLLSSFFTFIVDPRPEEAVLHPSSPPLVINEGIMPPGSPDPMYVIKAKAMDKFAEDVRAFENPTNYMLKAKPNNSRVVSMAWGAIDENNEV